MVPKLHPALEKIAPLKSPLNQASLTYLIRLYSTRPDKCGTPIAQSAELAMQMLWVATWRSCPQIINVKWYDPALLLCRPGCAHHRQCLYWQWHGLPDRQGVLLLWSLRPLCQHPHCLLFFPGLHPSSCYGAQKQGVQGGAFWWHFPHPASWHHGRHQSAAGKTCEPLAEALLLGSSSA